MRPGDGPLGKVFFPESERTGPPDGGRPHSIVPGSAPGPGAESLHGPGGGEMRTVRSEWHRARASRTVAGGSCDRAQCLFQAKYYRRAVTGR
jgi:hypothetical protein